MAKITLRAYHRDIDNLINHGRTQEAVDHCIHILRFFPKDIDSYRLLGKAFLEAQRFSEASDVLNRVLSIIPDDFVSHLGMSIVREDEGNLDAAIFHMERAFEVKPSNSAVQDELRRLYGRRDGVEPPRVRLTRGALVRMYARGELYEQAITEIRAAQVEEANRLDLDIILAKMYLKIGKKTEATEICSKILTKLPMCLEANRMLTELLPGTTMADDVDAYQTRVNALDPYGAFVGDKFSSSAEVPENAVTLDYLDWQPGIQSPSLPAYDQESQIPQEAQTSFPDWVETLPEPSLAPPLEEFAFEASPALETAISSEHEIIEENQMPSEEDQIPEWMKSAGWQPSANDVVESSESAASSTLDEQEMTADNEIIKADLPEWLLDMAPSDTVEPVSPETPEEIEQFGKLFTPSETTSDTLSQPSEEETIHPGDGVEQELPDWLKTIAPSQDGQTQPSEHKEEILPEWLSDQEGLIQDESLEIVMPVEGQPEEKTPFIEPHELSSAIEEVERPDWISSTEISSDMLQSSEPADTGDVPLKETPAQEPSSVGESAMDMDDTLAWLESLAAKQGADEDTLITPPEERTEKPPEWLLQSTDEMAAIGESDDSSVLAEETRVFEEQGVSLDVSIDNPDLEIEIPETLTEPDQEIPENLPISVEFTQVTEQIGDHEEQVIGLDESLMTVPVEDGFTEPELSEVSIAESGAAKSDELPEWLDMESGGTQEGIPGETLTPAPSITQWLKSLEQTAPFSEEKPSIEQPAEDAMPDWLREIETSLPAEEEKIPETEAIGETSVSEVVETTDMTIDMEPTSIKEEAEWGESVEIPEQKVTEPLEEAGKTQPVVTSIEVIEKESTIPVDVQGEVSETLAPEAEDELTKARKAMQTGKVELSLEKYNQLIEDENQLDEVIKDLQEAIYQHPVDISLYQALGDAYSRNNQLQEALDTFVKAEELLR